MAVAARKKVEKMESDPVWKLPVVDTGHAVFRTVERPASVWSVLKSWHQGLLILMTIVVVFSALSMVLVQHIYRQQLRSIHVQMNTRDALNRVWSQLLVEQSAWAALDHVETVARLDLKMVVPDLSQVTYLPALPAVSALRAELASPPEPGAMIDRAAQARGETPATSASLPDRLSSDVSNASWMSLARRKTGHPET